MRKFAAVCMTVAVSMILLVGCGAKESGEGQTQVSKDEKKTLTITTWDYDSSPQFKMVKEGFEKLHPEVTIEVVDTQADEYNNKLTIMLAGKSDNADIIFVKDTGTQLGMKNKGQILNLDKYIKESNVDLSMYNGAAQQLEMDGSMYSMPYRSDWYTLYYNKDLFDAAGVEYPSNDMTWEEYEALAKKMTSGEGSNKIYGGHNHTWMAMVANWAVQDGKNTLITEDYSFLKPYYEQALRLQKEGIVMDYATLKTGNIHYISVFKNQQVAMMPMGTWFIGTMLQSQADKEIDFNWGVATIPHPEGVEPGYTVGAVTPVAINAKTDEPDLAWEFVKYATSKEVAEQFADVGIFAAIQSEEILNKIAEIEGFPSESKEALRVKNLVLDRPLHKDIEVIRKAIEEEHDMIMIGESSIDDGIANMNKRMKEIIDTK